MLDAIFFCKNDLNSLLTKLYLSSDTTISGKACEAKVDLILSMVTLEVAEFTQWIPIHLEWALIISKNIFPIKRTRIIYVHSRPRAARPFARV